MLGEFSSVFGVFWEPSRTAGGAEGECSGASGAVKPLGGGRACGTACGDLATPQIMGSWTRAKSEKLLHQVKNCACKPKFVKNT